MTIEITQLENESDIVFLYRQHFIESNKNNPLIKTSDLVKYSKIAANIKFKYCKYDFCNNKELASLFANK